MPEKHNPDLSRASTIPSDWYFRGEMLEKEHRHVFHRTWQLVGFTKDVQKPGDFFSAKIGRENIFVCLNEASEIRGYANVCRHRAGLLVRGCGNSSSIKCRYHGWTYDLQGNLRTTPEFAGVQDFDPSKQDLPKVNVETWGPLVFAAIDPAMSFLEFLGRIPEDLKDARLQEMEYWTRVDYSVDANWKVYVDNYVEGYHIPMVHPVLNQELDYRNYKTETFDWYSLQHAPAKPSATVYNKGAEPQAHYYWIYPNLMFNIYQGIFQTNLVIPDGPDKTIVRFDWFALPEISIERRKELSGFSDLVQEEDAQICKEVYENLRSVTYSKGRYCVKRENGLHHFHQLLCRQLDV